MDSSELLLQAARSGDEAALDDLLARHLGRLVRFVQASMSAGLAGTVTAEDIVQEAAIVAARRFPEFEDRGPGAFYGWLVSIARFKLSEAERARHAEKRSRVQFGEVERPAGSTSPSLHAMRSEDGVRLRAALAEIRPDQAQAVRLRYLEGLSVAETSARLDRSGDAVKALVARGLEALAQHLG